MSVPFLGSHSEIFSPLKPFFSPTKQLRCFAALLILPFPLSRFFSHCVSASSSFGFYGRGFTSAVLMLLAFFFSSSSGPEIVYRTCTLQAPAAIKDPVPFFGISCGATVMIFFEFPHPEIPPPVPPLTIFSEDLGTAQELLDEMAPPSPSAFLSFFSVFKHCEASPP